MNSSVRVLSGSLLAAIIGTSAFGGPYEDAALGSMAKGPKWPITLVGANAHDTVGGLMPLSLWPPVTVGQVPPKSSWKRRDFAERHATVRRGPTMTLRRREAAKSDQH
jgi:hypothetical protein